MSESIAGRTAASCWAVASSSSCLMPLFFKDVSSIAFDASIVSFFTKAARLKLEASCNTTKGLPRCSSWTDLFPPCEHRIHPPTQRTPSFRSRSRGNHRACTAMPTLDRTHSHWHGMTTATQTAHQPRASRSGSPHTSTPASMDRSTRAVAAQVQVQTSHESKGLA